MERFCWLLSEALAQRGHSVEIVGGPPSPVRLRERAFGHWMRWSREAGRELAALDSDVLVSNGLLGTGIPNSRRRVHVYHGVFPARSIVADGNQPVRERARRIVNAGLAEGLSGRGATVVAVSRSAARQARRFYGVREAVVIPNAVDTAIFRPGSREDARRYFDIPDSARIALFVGRLEYTKGGDFVAAGVARAGFELAVAGRTAPVGSRHLGQLGTSDLVLAYRAADCIVLPSRYEACSLAGLEALASGIPLVCTRVGWFEDLLRAVPEYSPLVCEPNADSLTACLREFAEGDHRAAVAKARALVLQDNSMAAFAERWGGLIERVAR